MSDREIMNSKVGIPIWWKPNLSFIKKDWSIHQDLKKFINKPSTDTKCECEYPKLVELCEHDFCTRGRIDTKVCIKCNEIYSFSIVK